MSNELEQFIEAITKMGNAISEETTFEQLRPYMQTIYDIFWQAYQEAGMPYGEDGLGRWLEGNKEQE